MLGISKDIKYPGLNILPPGVERHIVNGGGLTAFHIFPDDEIEIINNEGNQICEISVSVSYTHLTLPTNREV